MSTANAMTPFLDSLAQQFNGTPQQRDILDSVIKNGLPTIRQEQWKYTNLRPLERRTYSVAPTVADIDPQLLKDIPAPRLVYLNGRFSAAYSDISEIAAQVEFTSYAEILNSPDARENAVLYHQVDTHDVFAQLNSALVQDGVILKLAAGTVVTTPVHLVFVSTGQAEYASAAHIRNLIELRANAQLTLITHFLHQGDHQNLVNCYSHFHLGQHAQLNHLIIQNESSGSQFFHRSDSVLASHARLQLLDMHLGGGMMRQTIHHRLEGNNAHVIGNGILLASESQQLDVRLNTEHIARDTRCNLTWRGMADDRARASFYGAIMIREGADGTAAMLSDKNLLLSDQAEINTQPALEIYADEVQAAHGATVGQIDQTALFYLRSRGIPVEQAKALLTAAFCQEAVTSLEDDFLRQYAQQPLSHALRRMHTGPSI